MVRRSKFRLSRQLVYVRMLNGSSSRYKESVDMMKKDQFVVRHGDDWAVKGAGNSRATKVVSTQKEAMKIARDIARNQNSEMRVQNRNGKFRTCNSYGNDHCPPKDKNY